MFVSSPHAMLTIVFVARASRLCTLCASSPRPAHPYPTQFEVSVVYLEQWGSQGGQCGRSPARPSQRASRHACKCRHRIMRNHMRVMNKMSIEAVAGLSLGTLRLPTYQQLLMRSTPSLVLLRRTSQEVHPRCCEAR